MLDCMGWGGYEGSDLLVAVALVARSLVGVGVMEEGELHLVLDCS